MKNLKLITLTVAIITLLARILAFIRDIMITSKFGASYMTDAYNIAYLVVIIVFTLINSALYNALIPIFTQIKNSKDKKYFHDFINNTINISIIISIIFLVLSLALNKPIINLLAPKANDETKNIAMVLLNIGNISFLFLMLNSVFTALLRVYDKFLIPSIASLLFPIPNIIQMALLHKSSVNILMVTTVLGYFLQLIVLFPQLMKIGYKYKYYVSFKDEHIKSMCRLSIPLIISSGAFQINTIASSMIVSSFGEGYITELSMANKINGVIVSIISTTIITVVFPYISKLATENNKNNVKIALFKNETVLLLIILPISIILFQYSDKIFAVLLLRGNYTYSAVKLTTDIFKFFMLGVFFESARNLYYSVHYSYNDTKMPMYSSIVAVSINVILSILLSRTVGVIGISLAASCASFVNCIILRISIVKKFNISFEFIENQIAQIVISGICCNALILLMRYILPESNIVILIEMSLAFVVYIVVLILFKHRMVMDLIKSVQNIIYFKMLCIGKKDIEKVN